MKKKVKDIYCPECGGQLIIRYKRLCCEYCGHYEFRGTQIEFFVPVRGDGFTIDSPFLIGKNQEAIYTKVNHVYSKMYRKKIVKEIHRKAQKIIDRNCLIKKRK